MYIKHTKAWQPIESANTKATLKQVLHNNSGGNNSACEQARQFTQRLGYLDLCGHLTTHVIEQIL